MWVRLKVGTVIGTPHCTPFVNIRLDQKVLKVKNALAYHVEVADRMKKSFVAFVPGKVVDHVWSVAS
jgi:hypothetical protein